MRRRNFIPSGGAKIVLVHATKALPHTMRTRSGVRLLRPRQPLQRSQRITRYSCLTDVVFGNESPRQSRPAPLGSGPSLGTELSPVDATHDISRALCQPDSKK